MKQHILPLKYIHVHVTQNIPKSKPFAALPFSLPRLLIRQGEMLLAIQPVSIEENTITSPLSTRYLRPYCAVATLLK